MKAAVITFPGSNCDDDLVYALEKVCELNTSRLWHKDTPSLDAYDLIAIPGGFSYGDYLRCGAMAAHSPIMEKVKEAAAGGKLVLGVCNGFQILCEANLLPGALARNEGLRFVCKDVEMTTLSNTSPWTNALSKDEKVVLPIAHGDGRYVVTESEYADLLKKEQILFSYSTNPNGSTFDIAGVCNPTKNVFGLMPHPERASDLRSKDGLKIFHSVLNYLKERSA